MGYNFNTSRAPWDVKLDYRGITLNSVLTYVRNNRTEVERFVKFMVVGVIGAVVDFGSYNLMIELVGLPPEVAGTISFVLAICSNFVWNRFWTYPDSRSKPILQQFVQFFVVNALGIIIRLPIIALTKGPFGQLAERLLSLEPETAETLGNNVALAVAVVIVMFWNFFVNRFWTYSDVGGWGDAANLQEGD
jgi:putative flippase GtrA